MDLARRHLTPPVTDADHIRGGTTAPTTLTVYGDYQCPYTRRAMREIAVVADQIGDRFRFVYRHFPLRDIHPYAEAAAELAEAATEVGTFWEAHDHLFAHQDELDPAHLAAYAAEKGIQSQGSVAGPFLAAERHIERVEADVQSGIRSGVEGTPAIFLNGTQYTGGYDAGTLRAAIDRAP